MGLAFALFSKIPYYLGFPSVGSRSHQHKYCGLRRSHRRRASSAGGLGSLVPPERNRMNANWLQEGTYETALRYCIPSPIGWNGVDQSRRTCGLSTFTSLCALQCCAVRWRFFPTRRGCLTIGIIACLVTNVHLGFRECLDSRHPIGSASSCRTRPTTRRQVTLLLQPVSSTSEGWVIVSGGPTLAPWLTRAAVRVPIPWQRLLRL